jgi:hypothetical protein
MMGEPQADLRYVDSPNRYVLLRDIEDEVRAHGRLGDLEQFMQGARLDERNIASTILCLLANRDYHHQREEDLTRRLQALEAEEATRALFDRSTAQTLRLLTVEMQQLTDQFNQQVGGPPKGAEREERAFKRSRTGL